MSQQSEQVPEITVTSHSFWANTHIKRKIRSVLGARILGTISIQIQHLKRKILLCVYVCTLLTLTASGTQTEIGSFADDRDNRQSIDDGPNKPEPATASDGHDADQDDAETDYGEDAPKGLVYARVSSGGQLDGETSDSGYDEGSISGQIEELEDLAEKEGIELPHDPITDEAQTGTNFNREGIQEVFEIAKREEIDYLLVEKVDRVGRSAPETLYFLYVLQSECSVTLLTPAGEQNVAQVKGLLHTTLMSLMAEVQNEIRTNKAKKSRIRGFLNQKNWNNYTHTVPVGYNQDEAGWLVIDYEEKTIVRDMFRKFVECETYAETERYIDKKYGTSVLDGHRVRTLLTEMTYIGKPRLPDQWVTETTYENDMECPELHLLEEESDAEVDVTEDVFHKAQEIIEEKDKKHSEDEETEGVLDFIEEFSLFAVVEGSDPARLVHHCGEPLVRDGQVDLKGRKVHRYRCPSCEKSESAEEYYKRWPTEAELDAIKMIQKVLTGGLDKFPFISSE